MPERHTAENIASRLQECVREFGLTGKVECCVHDNARNIQKAGTLCPEWGDHSCFAHTLQLCIKPVLELPSVSKVLSKCRKLVRHFKHSTTVTAELHRRQERMQKEGEKQPTLALIQDVPTRWNSTQLMCSRLDKLRRVVTDIMLDDDVTEEADRDLLLRDGEWGIVADISTVLGPFTHVTTFMSKDKDVSIGEMFPIVYSLVGKVLQPCNNDTALVASMKTTFRDEMTERFQPGRDETAESLPMLASLLDPRYKKLSFLPRQLRRRTHTMLEGRLDDVPFKVSSRDDGDCATPAKRPRLEFMVTAPESSVEDDLQLYLAEKMDDATPALEWWRRNENRFPKVVQVARSVLAVPATSVPSERVFSSAGLVLNKLRNRLNSDIVGAILFLNKNMRSVKCDTE
ncbi:E3 SUMO-protein ligase ZBED1-like [Mya arenaria]|uniref:E3 SUMO-protein ligase ZBED1-like n=1 Tax=Mya arenaria TaxID=6604 RepID=UPI0022DF0FB3|nr:E3 SUMO-protein ligase ZBED1-like [Mya arenaria]